MTIKKLSLTKKAKKQSKQRYIYKRRTLDEAVTDNAENLEIVAIQRSENVKHGSKLKQVKDYINMFNIEDPETSKKCLELCKVYFNVEIRTF